MFTKNIDQAINMGITIESESKSSLFRWAAFSFLVLSHVRGSLIGDTFISY